MIHYSVELNGEYLWDGRTPCPPCVGDVLVIDCKRFVVIRRVWGTALDDLGRSAIAAWELDEGSHISVTLVVEEQ